MMSCNVCDNPVLKSGKCRFCNNEQLIQNARARQQKILEDAKKRHERLQLPKPVSVQKQEYSDPESESEVQFDDFEAAPDIVQPTNAGSNFHTYAEYERTFGQFSSAKFALATELGKTIALKAAELKTLQDKVQACDQQLQDLKQLYEKVI